MGYCKDCKVLFSSDVTVCSYCEPGELESYPPEPSQGEWISLPFIPNIAEARKVGDALEEEAIQYYINQPGTTFNIMVGSDKYDRAKEIQANVLG